MADTADPDFDRNRYRTPEDGEPAGQEAAPIRRTREVLAFHNPFVDVYDDEVVFPSGATGTYLRIRSSTEGLGVVVLPVHEGTVGLVRTYRYPLGRHQWGLPRGFAQGTDPLATARAELLEELGVAEAGFRLLGTMTPDSGLLAAEVAVVLATVPTRPAARAADDEVTAARWITLPDLWREVAAGAVDDGMTLAALAIAMARGGLPLT